MRGAIAICSLLILTMVVQLLAQMQATSRFVFSLARDNAMPFSEQIRRTNAAKVPVIANWVTVGLCAPFCLLVIANSRTLHAVLIVTAGMLTFLGYVSLGAFLQLTPDRANLPVLALRSRSAV